MWLDDKSKQDPYNRLVTPPGTQSVGAGGGLAQPGGTTSNPSTQSPTPTSEAPQEFATVQDYLGANKAQGEQLGQKVTSSLGDTLNQQKNTISGAVGQAKSDISSGITAYDPNLITSALNDPTKVTEDSGQLDSFLKQWNAAYSGPQSFESSSSYAPAVTAANEAASKKAQTETIGGQQQLLQDQFGVYGQGNKALDQTLLQNSSAFPQVQNQAKEFGTVQDYLASQAKDVNAQAAQAKATTDQTKAQTQGAFTNKLTDFQSGLNEKVAAKKADAQKVADKYKANLATAGQVGGDPTALLKDISMAGASPQELQTLKDYFSGLSSYKMSGDLGNFTTVNPNVDVTTANVATPEDYAKAAAYQKLTGVNYGGVLNPADATAATQPAFVPRPGRTLPELQKLADAQIRNFGSADPGILNDIKSLTDLGTNAPTQADQNFQPANNPFDIQGLTGYLKGQVNPRDQQLLATNSPKFNNMDLDSIKGKQPSKDFMSAYAQAFGYNNDIVNDPSSWGRVQEGLGKNAQQGQEFAQKLVDAAGRSGSREGLDKFYKHMLVLWNKTPTQAGQKMPSKDPNNPNYAGFKAFLDIMGPAMGEDYTKANPQSYSGY